VCCGFIAAKERFKELVPTEYFSAAMEEIEKAPPSFTFGKEYVIVSTFSNLK